MKNDSGITCHRVMGLGIDECERLVCANGKTTAIIATESAGLQCLAWSIFSLLLRSTPKSVLDHIIVVINGPDRRTGDTGLQDAKQSFLEELREQQWASVGISINMPLTVIRVWSSIGHAQAIEAAMPWVRTQSYLLMHDDAILRMPDWQETAKAVMAQPDVAIAATPDVCKYWHGNAPAAVTMGLEISGHPQRAGEVNVVYPHINTVFALCRKDLLAKTGARWCGYSVNSNDGTELIDQSTLRAMRDDHCRRFYVDREGAATGRATMISMDIGSWIYAGCIDSGFRFAEFHRGTVRHMVGMSWHGQEERAANVRKAWESEEVALLESDLQSAPGFFDIYKRHVRRDG